MTTSDQRPQYQAGPPTADDLRAVSFTPASMLHPGYTDREVLRRPAEILRDADRTLDRAHDPGRLDAWYALLRQSCFTPPGRTLLLRRLGLSGDLAALTRPNPALVHQLAHKRPCVAPVRVVCGPVCSRRAHRGTSKPGLFTSCV